MLGSFGERLFSLTAAVTKSYLKFELEVETAESSQTSFLQPSRIKLLAFQFYSFCIFLEIF